MNDMSELRLVGGCLVLDFLNTRSGPPDRGWSVDALVSYPSLVVWAQRAGELTLTEADAVGAAAAQDAAAADHALRRARVARDELDALFRPLAGGGDPDASLLEQLGENEVAALRHARLDAAAGYSWSWAGDQSLLRPLRPVFHSAVDLLGSPRLERLKQCQGCSYLFLDESKNRSRRWCSMGDCGTEAKMSRYIAARRARAASA